MSSFEITDEFDLFVVGGGSGGLACAKTAADNGLKVACADFVKPSPLGTTWGLGGTCVNVGCIPKKLFHQAALHKQNMEDAKAFGWEYAEESVQHNWGTMVQNVQNHIKSLNFGYRTELRSKSVAYVNALAKLVDANTVECTDKKGKVKYYKAKNFVIAVGGRPNYPDCPGAKEYAMTSDDIFSYPKFPGKTLVVGASYIALETGGAMAHLGCDVTIMVRSILLRGFDQEIAGMIGTYMEEHNTKFLRGVTPTNIVKGEDGKLTVTHSDGNSSVYDNVVFAVGRYIDTAALGLDTVGVKFNAKTGKIPAFNEQTNIPNIFAIGDVLEGRPELTPVAIQAGRLLADRLAGKSNAMMNYRLIPTTVFTPLEYSSCGLSEEEAIEELGSSDPKDLKVYHQYFKPLEWTVPHREDNACYAKIICDVNDDERIIGMHFLGPNAGEVMQAFALSMRCGATKAQLDMTVGIHPTTVETFTGMTVFKGSGQSAEAGSC